MLSCAEAKTLHRNLIYETQLVFSPHKGPYFGHIVSLLGYLSPYYRSTLPACPSRPTRPYYLSDTRLEEMTSTLTYSIHLVEFFGLVMYFIAQMHSLATFCLRFGGKFSQLDTRCPVRCLGHPFPTLEPSDLGCSTKPQRTMNRLAY